MINAAQVRELFEELLERISDTQLQEQVVDTWVDACREGGWDELEAVERMPFSMLTDCRGVGFIEHILAVTWGALGLAEAQERACRDLPYKINHDHLIAGALLHDVGKLIEIESDSRGGYRTSHSGRCLRHPISGTVLAARAGLPDEVLNIIACHSREGDGSPKVVETILIHQADFASFDPLRMKADGTLIGGE